MFPTIILNLEAMESNHIPHVLHGLKGLYCFNMKIVKIRHVIRVSIVWHLFLF
jgi:hypothetical protein